MTVQALVATFMEFSKIRIKTLRNKTYYPERYQAEVRAWESCRDKVLSADIPSPEEVAFIAKWEQVLAHYQPVQPA